jgi:hypothetical protein
VQVYVISVAITNDIPNQPQAPNKEITWWLENYLKTDVLGGWTGLGEKTQRGAVVGLADAMWMPRGMEILLLGLLGAGGRRGSSVVWWWGTARCWWRRAGAQWWAAHRGAGDGGRLRACLD